MMVPLLEEKRSEVSALCRKFEVRRLELFGSATRKSGAGAFEAGRSDIDLMVEFNPSGWEGASRRYFGLLHGLEDLLGMPVDLVDRSAVANPYFLEVAEKTTELLYAG